jgi:hypothetical protein
MKIWIFQTVSNGETFEIKVVDLEKLWNFVAYNIFVRKHIINKKTTFESLKFEFQILETASKGETPKMKVVDLKTLWNFVVQPFNLNTFRASTK